MATPSDLDQGIVLFDLGRYEEALQKFNQHLGRFPQDALGLGWKADCLRKLKRFEKALEVINQAVYCSPSNARFFEVRFFILKDLERFEEAYNSAREAVRLEPNNISYLTTLTFAAYKIDRFEEAFPLADQILNVEPQHILALQTKAIAYNGIGNLRKSAQYYRQCIAIEPNESFHYENLGSCLGGMGLYGEAQKSLRRALELDPQSERALELYFRVLFRLKEYQEAQKYLELACIQRPYDVDLYVSASLLYSKARLFTEAEKYLEKAYQLSSDSYDFEIFLAELQLANLKRDKERLLRLFSKWEANDPKGDYFLYRSIYVEPLFGLELLRKCDDWKKKVPSLKFLLHLRRIYDLLGDKVEALANAKKLLSLYPQYPHAWSQAAATFALQQSKEEMEKLEKQINSYKEDYAQDHSIWKALGHIARGKEENEKALECYQKALEHEPESCCIIVGMGLAYIQKGDFEKAESKKTHFEEKKHFACEHCPEANSFLELIQLRKS